MTQMPSEFSVVTRDVAKRAVEAMESEHPRWRTSPELLEAIVELGDLPEYDFEALVYVIGEGLGVELGDALAVAGLLDALGFGRLGAIGDPAASRPTL